MLRRSKTGPYLTTTWAGSVSTISALPWYSSILPVISSGLPFQAAALGNFAVFSFETKPENGAVRARAFMYGVGEIALEDPATGSAAGPLMAYAHARTGVARLAIDQGVAMGRASRLLCEAGERVRVAGDAVVVFEATVEL